MTKGELIKALEFLPDDAEVFVFTKAEPFSASYILTTPTNNVAEEHIRAVCS